MNEHKKICIAELNIRAGYTTEYRRKNERTLVGQYPFVKSAPHFNDQMKNTPNNCMPVQNNQSTQFLGGLPVPNRDKCGNYHYTMRHIR